MNNLKRQREFVESVDRLSKLAEELKGAPSVPRLRAAS